ncbi:unnamed protein product [Rhizophagus irregularis]|nr:unnamed protein product [Rhizophagus irregularis]
MLHRNKVNGEDITSIKQFTPVFEEINDDDKAFVLQKDISGEDATGRVDYTIKSLEEFLCITEGNHVILKLDMLKIWRNLKGRSGIL